MFALIDQKCRFLVIEFLTLTLAKPLLSLLDNNFLVDTTGWRQGNGQAERFMSPVIKAIRTAYVQGKHWRDGYHKLCKTLHCATNIPTAGVKFNRNIRKFNTELARRS